MAELFDLYDGEGRPLGVAKERSLVHRDGDWHRSIHLWVVRRDGRLIFQQRCADKDTMPGLLTATVGGHYSAGERLAGVLREAREEVGVSVGVDALIPLGVWRYEDASGAGVIDREWQDVFIWPCEDALLSFHPDLSEVPALVEVQAGDLLALLHGTSPTVDGRRLDARDRTLAEVALTLDRFVPSSTYHERIAVAALAHAAGVRPRLHP